jgi:hypothetical protein
MAAGHHRSGLCFVEALKRTVGAFIEVPIANDGNPHQVHLVEDDPERADGALEDGCVGEVEFEALGLEQLPCLGGFAASGFR